MAEENISQIFELIEGLRSQNEETISECNSHLGEIISDPNNVFIFFSAISSANEAYQKEYCLTFLHRMFSMINPQIFFQNESFMELFQQFLLQTLTAETNNHNAFLTCDLLQQLSFELFKKGSWTEGYQFGLEISQQMSEKAAVGLYFIECIFGSIPIDDQNQLFLQIVPIMVQSFSSSFESVRIKAYKLFSQICVSMENPDIWESVPTVFDTIKAAVFSAFQQNKSNAEINTLFSVTGSLMNMHYAYFSASALEFLNFCIAVIGDDTIPLQRKMLSHSLFEESLSFVLNTKDDGEDPFDIADCFDKVIKIALQLCESDRQSNDFILFQDIVRDLAFFVGYDTIQATMNQLLELESETGIQTALFIAHAAFPAVSQGFSENYADIMGLMKASFSTADEEIIDSSIWLFDDFMQGCFPALISNYDESIEMFLNDQCLTNRNVIVSLDTFINKAMKQSTHSVDLVSDILERIRAEDADPKIIPDYLSLLSTLVLYMEPSQELFEGLVPLIDELSEHHDFCSNVPRFISSLASLSPNDFVQNIGEIIEKLSALLGNSFETNLEIADAVIRIVHKMPRTCVNVAQALVEIINNIYSTEKGDDESEYYHRSKVDSIRAFGCIFKISQEALEPISENFNEFLLSFLQSDTYDEHKGAIYAIYECAEVLDASQFIQFFLQNNKFDPTLQELIFLAMNEIFITANSEILFPILGDLVTYFMANITEMSTVDQLENVEQRNALISNAFEAFSNLCQIGGAHLAPLTETIISQLMELLDNDVNMFRANSLRVLTVITTKCVTDPNLFGALLTASVQFSVEPSIEVSSAGLNALRFFVENDGVLEDLEDPIQVALHSISEGNIALIPYCVAFLLSCASKGAALPIQEIIDSLDNVSFTQELLVTIAGKAAVLGIMKPRLSILALSSLEFYWQQIAMFKPQFVSSLSTLSEEQIYSQISYNEGKMELIQLRTSQTPEIPQTL